MVQWNTHFLFVSYIFPNFPIKSAVDISALLGNNSGLDNIKARYNLHLGSVPKVEKTLYPAFVRLIMDSTDNRCNDQPAFRLRTAL